MNERTLHMVGNAHIDPVWLWQWPEGYQEVRATFASALARMHEYPDFVFTHTSVLFLRWIEESDPEMFEQIRARIGEGRWQVVGGWWIEPDCNIPSGESFVRQGLYGQRYLREKFGITATTGANLDSFGHNASLPQILRKSGLDSYVFLRPKPEENAGLPGPLFWWEAADGTRVLAYRIPHEYCAPPGELDVHVEETLATLPSDLDELAVFYGVGNHGGGPTKANLDSIARLNGNGQRLRLSSLRAFFDSVARDDLPVWRGELQYHSPGCYTTHSGIKRWNRRAENALQRAEKWSAVAARIGAQAYPLGELSEAWQLLLFNQFHDTLAGTSIEPAYEDARDQIGHASSIAALAFNRAVQSIARQIDIPFDDEGTWPLVVFNPHPWRLRTDVELEYNWMKPEGVRLVDAEGTAIPVQQTRSLTTMSSNRARLVFPADVPPLGYRVYAIRRGAGEASQLAATDTTLENEHVLLEIDRVTGRIARLVHKETGANVAGSARHAVVVEDLSDTWGHDVVAYDKEVGEFEPMSVRLVENGPVRAILRVESRYGDSLLREDYALSAESRHVDVNVVLDWHERLRLLKLRYPTGIEDGVAATETPYGHLVREANGHEDPGQSWVDVSGEGRGLTVINDAKHGYDVRGGDIGVSVVRSPVWAWHDPRELEADGDFEYMDEGRQRFRVRLVPHGGDWRDARVVRLAAELNQPPFALLESFHDGPLESQGSYGDDGNGDVVVTVVKQSEDGDGFVVRAFESSGRDAQANLDVLGFTWQADFRANEIKTFRLSGGEVVETDLLEL